MFLLIVISRARRAAILDTIRNQCGKIVAPVVHAAVEDICIALGGEVGLVIEGWTVERDAEDLRW